MAKSEVCILLSLTIGVAWAGWGGPHDTCGTGSSGCGSWTCWSSCSSQGGCATGEECCCDRPFCSCTKVWANTTWHYGPPKFTMTVHIDVAQLNDRNPGLLRTVKVYHDSERGLELVKFDTGTVVLSDYEAGKAFYTESEGMCHEYLLNKDGKRHELFKMQWRNGMTLHSEGHAAAAWMKLTQNDLPESYTAYDKNQQRQFAHMHFTDVKQVVDPSVFIRPSGCRPSLLELTREDIIYQPHVTLGNTGMQLVV